MTYGSVYSDLVRHSLYRSLRLVRRIFIIIFNVYDQTYFISQHQTIRNLLIVEDEFGKTALEYCKRAADIFTRILISNQFELSNLPFTSYHVHESILLPFGKKKLFVLYDICGKLYSISTNSPLKTRSCNTPNTSRLLISRGIISLITFIVKSTALMPCELSTTLIIKSSISLVWLIFHIPRCEFNIIIH